MAEERRHALVGGFQVFDGLEQGDQVEGERGEARVVRVGRTVRATRPGWLVQPGGGDETRLLGQQQNLEQVAHGVGHADHVGLDRPRVEGDRLARHGQGFHDAGGALGQLRPRRQERARVVELGGEHLQALVLGQGGVVLDDAGEAQDLRHRRLVDAAVLADVEAGEGEAEALDQRLHPGQAAVAGDLAEPGGPEAPADQFEVGSQVGEPVGGLVRRLVQRSSVLEAGAELADSLDHEAELAPVGLVADLAVAGRLALRREPLPFGVAGEGLEQLVRDRHLAVGERQLAAQGPELFLDPAERRAPLHPDRPAGDLRRDVRVAVPVAADPGAVAQAEAWDGGLTVFTESALQRPLDVFADARHRLPDHVAEEVEPLLDLVLDARPLGRDLVGGEQHGDLHVELLEQAVALVRRGAFTLEGVEQLADPLLLEQHRAAARLGRVGGQRRLDVEALDQREDLLGVPSGAGQPGQGRVDGLRARRATGTGGAGPLPVDAQDLLLLGLVDQVEEGGEGAQQPDDLVQVEAGDALTEPPAQIRVVLADRPLGEPPQLLDPRQGLRARPVLDRLAEEGAEQVDLLGERFRDPGALRSELQALPTLSVRCHARWGRSPRPPSGMVAWAAFRKLPAQW